MNWFEQACFRLTISYMQHMRSDRKSLSKVCQFRDCCAVTPFAMSFEIIFWSQSQSCNFNAIMLCMSLCCASGSIGLLRYVLM